MSKLKLEFFPLGDLAVNCYLLYDQDTKNALIIDAPLGVKTVLNRADALGLKVCALLLTHEHYDHIEGLNKIDLDFYIHPEGKDALTDPSCNMSVYMGNSFTIEREPLLFSGSTLKIADFDIEVMHTPGHAPGSVCLKIDDMLFSGDLLFFDSIGRTDIPHASHDAIMKSLKDKIMPLDDNVSVFPGHGPSTTIGREKEHNPFLL